MDSATGFYPEGSRFKSGAARLCSVGVADISPGPQPGDCQFDPGAEHPRPIVSGFSHTRYEGWPRARTGKDGKARHLDLAWSNQAGRRTVNAYGEGSNPSARARRRKPPHGAARGLKQQWSCRGDGVPATPSRWRSRVRTPSGPPPRPHSSAAECQDDNPDGHVRLVLRVPSAHRLKDQGTRLRISRWGFDSSWARSSSASSMAERPVHTRGTEVRLLR